MVININYINIHCRYSGRYIRVNRTREQHSIDLSAGAPWECVELSALGTDKTLFTNILDEGKILKLELLNECIVI